MVLHKTSNGFALYTCIIVRGLTGPARYHEKRINNYNWIRLLVVFIQKLDQPDISKRLDENGIAHYKLHGG